MSGVRGETSPPHHLSDWLRSRVSTATVCHRAAGQGLTQTLPPTDVIGLTGDLGQTNDSATNMRHFSEDPELDSVLHVGDLSYADSLMARWDSWGRLVESVAARVPWMVSAGK